MPLLHQLVFQRHQLLHHRARVVERLARRLGLLERALRLDEGPQVEDVREQRLVAFVVARELGLGLRRQTAELPTDLTDRPRVGDRSLARATQAPQER